jgi:PAS domain S-box-containing protein
MLLVRNLNELAGLELGAMAQITAGSSSSWESIASMREKECFNMLCNTADGVYIVDADKRILRWNKGAEKILGYVEPEVQNQECYRVLSGKSQPDKPLCGQTCRIHSSALKGILPKNYDMLVRSSEGKPRWINVSIFAKADGEEPFVAHLIRDITPEKTKGLALEQFLADLNAQDLISKSSQGEKPAAKAAPAIQPQQPNKPAAVLSERELEVLTLLAEGLPTKSMAQKLNISHFTARNHIQNILVKLNLHSKAQAVSYAFKKGIL